MPLTTTFIPVVKFKDAISVASVVPSSLIVISGVAEALTIESAPIVTPFSSKSLPSNKIYLFALPNTIFPPVRFRNAPLSVPLGALSASGIVPPFIVPAVTAPKSAERAERFVVVISEALIVVASIIVDTIEFDLM